MSIHSPMTIPSRRPQSAAATDGPEAGREGATAGLQRRITAARVAGEHHLWEAVRILPSLSSLKDDPGAIGQFRALMAADALADAVLYLMTVARPARRLASLSAARDGWTCRVTGDGGSRRRHACTLTTTHRDQAAALLAALVASEAPASPAA